MKTTPTCELEGPAYHEGIPGYHMQIAIAEELTAVPKFRSSAPCAARNACGAGK